jgi:O-antigen/teichoic acid export membrane protein
MGGFTFIRAWNNIYAIFLNGIGKIGLQVKIAIIQSVMNIPLSIFLGRRIGVSGVLLATIISLSLFAIAGPIQTLIILGRERRS